MSTPLNDVSRVAPLVTQNISQSPQLSHRSAGLSEVSSSVHANDSEMGFFQQIKEKVVVIWRVLMSCFSCIFRSCSQVLSILTSTSQDRLRRRIEKGREMLEEQMNSAYLREANPARTVVVVVLKYNNVAQVHHFRLTEGIDRVRRGTDDLLHYLLLTQEHCEQGRLSIDTLILKRQADSSIDYIDLESWVEFPSSRSGGRPEFLEGIDQSSIENNLRRLVPEPYLPLCNRAMCFIQRHL